MFVYVWEYRVAPESRDEFERVYSARGTWVTLFTHGSGYLRTELLRDADDPERFLTIDYWASRAARDRFRRAFAEDFEQLDAASEALTIEERFIGDFESAGETPSSP